MKIFIGKCKISNQNEVTPIRSKDQICGRIPLPRKLDRFCMEEVLHILVIWTRKIRKDTLQMICVFRFG